MFCIGTSNPDCRLCELGGTALHTCIPTTPYSCVWPRSTKQALLIVAQSPGYEEDQVGRNLIGPSGHVLQNVYLGHEIPHLVDIYLANTVRCYVPAGTDIQKAWPKACRPYLEDDIKDLEPLYGRLIILCLGAVATAAILGKTLKEGMSSQGGASPQGHVSFSTYHPAYLMYTGGDKKACKPQYVGAVGSHMTLLIQHLRGEEIRSAWTTDTPTPYLEPPNERKRRQTPRLDQRTVVCGK